MCVLNHNWISGTVGVMSHETHTDQQFLRLRECRRDMGFNIREAAEEIGVGVGTLQMAESGVRVPSPRVAKRIADFYKLKPSDFWPIAPRDRVAV